MENKNKIYHAVEKTPYRKDELKIFLAGTIDNGDSEDWQTKICKLIEECSTNSKPIAVYNPRRDDWPEDDQTKLIEEQIKWELEHMEKADLILMNICGDSKSPITLLELGIHSKENKLIVFCPLQNLLFSLSKLKVHHIVHMKSTVIHLYIIMIRE